MNACFSYFLHDQFSLGGSDFSSFIRVWNEAPITSFIFCGDFGSTTIKLLHWHEISVFKTNINSCCISSQHFRVITTPVTRTSEIYFLVGCAEKNKLLNVFYDTNLAAFSPLLAFILHWWCDKTQKNGISTLWGLQNPSKFCHAHILAPINRIYISQLHSILRCNLCWKKRIYKCYKEQL